MRRHLFVIVAALVVALLVGRDAVGYYPPGAVYRCGGTGFLHVTGDVEDSNCQSVNLSSSSDVTGQLPASKGGIGQTFPSPGAAGNALVSNGTTWTSGAAGVPFTHQWWSAVDRGVAEGLEAGGLGYPAGGVYRFLRAATITGVRFYCTGGGTQLFTVHVASSAEPGSGAQTELATKACTFAAGAAHTCTLTTPVSVSDLSLVYTATVYGGSGSATCTFLNVSPWTACVQAAAACAIGPALWLETNAMKFCTFNDPTCLPAGTDPNRNVAVEFAFAMP